MRSPWLAAAPLLIALALGACAGGACGDAPAPTRQPEPQQVSGKPSGGGGSGQVDIADWDKAQQQPEAAVAQPTAAAKAAKGLEKLDPAGFAARVVSGKGPSLVMLTGPKCGDCELAAPALQILAPEFASWTIASLDRPADAAQIPLDLRRLPPPAFLMHENGKALSQRQGLPFKRDRDESEADYRLRLTRWFRDALTQKSLALGKK